MIRHSTRLDRLFAKSTTTRPPYLTARHLQDKTFKEISISLKFKPAHAIQADRLKQNLTK
ncbi:MAG: hypothetical protein DRH24_06900 [Deltaproteobacteria bacterium]|nr:MAG: hypothetical protein DRH24_06900 [Deltaproteobacteria bacterium]